MESVKTEKTLPLIGMNEGNPRVSIEGNAGTHEAAKAATLSLVPDCCLANKVSTKCTSFS